MSDLTTNVQDATQETQYRYVDPLSLPRIEKSELADSGLGEAVYLEAPGVERQFFRYAPEFVDDPYATGMFSAVSTAVYTSHAPFITTTSDARLVGYRTILGSGVFFTDQSFGPSTPQFLDRLAQPQAFQNE